MRKAAEERTFMAHRKTREILELTGATRKGQPTVAGMMTLSDYPQQTFPNLCVTAIAVAGTSIVQDGNGERFLDNKRFEGPIDEMIDDAISFIRRNTKTRVIIEGGHRIDEPEYPDNAVREIVTNALMHRDYGPYCDGTPTRIVLYADRLECWNPGGVYGGQSIEDLGYINIQTRNPTLVSILEILGVAENRHSGIPVIRDEMRHAGLRPPVFIDERGSFTVKLFNSPDPGSMHEATGKLRVSEAAIIDFCRIPRSRGEIATHFALGLPYITREYLNPLVEQGRLTLTIPEKPRSKYQRFFAASNER